MFVVNTCLLKKYSEMSVVGNVKVEKAHSLSMGYQTIQKHKLYKKVNIFKNTILWNLTYPISFSKIILVHYHIMSF